MPVAAVPKYLQKDDSEFYLSAPPGHRFLLYFAVWGDNQKTNQLDWRMKDRVPKMKRQQGQLIQDGWEDLPNGHYACTIAACKTPTFDEERPRRSKPKTDPGLKPWQPMVSGLATRQSALAATLPEAELLRLAARSTAPFTTGLGNEHPLENGFAFLNPYGLPYLPGSGVKGVLRQAARELVSGEWGETHGWSDAPQYSWPASDSEVDKKPSGEKLSLLDILFGKESEDGDTEHLRGVLSFWDVIPQIAGDSLMVEIMTPHQSHYYQQKDAAGSATPHDSGQPNPISFLTVPPQSGFTFYVQCDLARLQRTAPELAENGKWKTLLTAAFEHAFAWLGFGAKTAVGYGAMESEAMRQARERAAIAREQIRKDEAKQQLAARQQAEAEPWPHARLKFNRTNKSLTAEKNGKTAYALDPRGEELLHSLPEDVRKRVETNQFVKVTAYVAGTVLVRVEP